MAEKTATWWLPFKYLWVGVREFYEGGGLTRASALAYATLLSLIPLVVVVLSIWGTIKDEALEDSDIAERAFDYLLWPREELVRLSPLSKEDPEIAKLFQEQDAIELDAKTAEAVLAAHGADKFTVESVHTARDELTGRLTEFVDNLRGNLKTIGLIGGLFLLLTTISLLNSIEATFNSLWLVRQGRNPVRKFLVFWALLTLGPLLIAASFVLQAKYGGDLLQQDWLLSLVPYFLTWLAFFLLYKFVPHTHVSSIGAVVAALIAGTLWELCKLVFSRYVAVVTTGSSYAQITYGSLALIPIFLFWLYVSWVLALFGGKLCHIWQTLGSFNGPGWTPARTRTGTQELHALSLVGRIVEHQYANENGMTRGELMRALSLPRHRLDALLESLERENVIASLPDSNRWVTVVPPDQLSLERVTRAIRGRDRIVDTSARTELPRKIERYLDRVAEERSAFLDRVTFRDLVHGDTAAESLKT